MVKTKEKWSEVILKSAPDEEIEFENGLRLQLDPHHFYFTGERKVINDMVISEDGKERGYVVREDEEADCGVEGCTGTVYEVLWFDGEITQCCSKGLNCIEEGLYKIAG